MSLADRRDPFVQMLSILARDAETFTEWCWRNGLRHPSDPNPFPRLRVLSWRKRR